MICFQELKERLTDQECPSRDENPKQKLLILFWYLQQLLLFELSHILDFRLRHNLTGSNTSYARTASISKAGGGQRNVNNEQLGYVCFFVYCSKQYFKTL
jgi:hypothetical protein